jgi:hypothetical protein
MPGIDLSPMVAMVGLWLIKLLVLDPVSDWARGMMYPGVSALLH